jgi:uncharacterized protein with HEPN domain
MRDAIDRARAYTESGREEFFAASMIQDAVVRNLEIVGEAATAEFAATGAGSAMARDGGGMQDKLVHDYFGVDLDLVWDVVASEFRPHGRGSSPSWRS